VVAREAAADDPRVVADAVGEGDGENEGPGVPNRPGTAMEIGEALIPAGILKCDIQTRT
jgi:hypothetical protein